VPQDGATLTTAEVRSHCRSYLSSNKVPDAVSFVRSVPAGHSGKLLRREMAGSRS
jgi:acyl-CoA synthetase (AMP-forming)/AMP-acid ligase II